ncbi:hypothetical protein HHK36_025096 [Tetracentron sinense]|uniref:HMA domain-containing protein n=1 Tax=Tetracentron sinense TaxID=13715 RepID=A0A834YK81_TETSI|nr:hypothetical protein HHK36_025096 [Tetracentron sinense]
MIAELNHGLDPAIHVLIMQTTAYIVLESIFSFASITVNFIGLNFVFLVLNLTKHSSYLIYNVAIFFSSVVQRQYCKKYECLYTVNITDAEQQKVIVSGSVDSATLIKKLVRSGKYAELWSSKSNKNQKQQSNCIKDGKNEKEHENQKVSKTCLAITSAVWATATVAVSIAVSVAIPGKTPPEKKVMKAGEKAEAERMFESKEFQVKGFEF